MSAVRYAAADHMAARIASVGRPVTDTAQLMAPVTASAMFMITALNTVLPMALAPARIMAAAITGAVAIAPRTVARPIGRVMIEAASWIAATENSEVANRAAY